MDDNLFKWGVQVVLKRLLSLFIEFEQIFLALNNFLLNPHIKGYPLQIKRPMDI